MREGSCVEQGGVDGCSGSLPSIAEVISGIDFRKVTAGMSELNEGNNEQKVNTRMGTHFGGGARTSMLGVSGDTLWEIIFPIQESERD